MHLKAVEDAIEGDRRRAGIDDAALHFHPCMGFEGESLRAEGQRGGDSEVPQQADQRGGALQALHFPEVEDTRKVDGSARLFACGVRLPAADGAVTDTPVNAGEVPPGERRFKRQQQHVGAKGESNQMHRDLAFRAIRDIFLARLKR